jgi:hypothetical protein
MLPRSPELSCRVFGSVRDGLLIFRGFVHDSQCVLAGISQSASVGIESGFDSTFGISREMRITALTNAQHWWVLFYDP